MKRELIRGLYLGISAAFLFACVGGISASIPRHIPTSQILFLQNGVAFFFLFIFFQQQVNWKENRPKFGLYFLRCFAGACSSYAFTASLRKLNLFDATLLNMTAPFYAPLIGVFWLKERVSWAIWPIVMLGFYGAALICAPTAGVFESSAFLALGSGLLTAVAFSALRRLNIYKEPVVRIILVLTGFSCLFNGMLSIVTWVNFTVWELFLVTFSGFLLGMNQFLLTHAFRFLPLSFVAPISYSVLPFAAIINWIYFSQPMNFYSWLGAILICLSGVFTHRIHSRLLSC